MEIRFTSIIVHRNGFERLKSALDSLIKASDLLDEIIIVDNASTDKSAHEISNHYPKVRIIYNNSNLGYGAAANRGIMSGSGKYFLICNNDILVPSNILNDFEKLFIKASKAGIISGQQTNFNGDILRTSMKMPSLLSEFDGVGRIDHSKDPKKIAEVGTLRGACLGVRKEMIEEIGAFDEDFFFYFEDTEWCIRANKKNWKVLLYPDIKVPHVGGSSSGEFFNESRVEFYRSRIIYWKKIYPRFVVILLQMWNIPKLFLDFVFYTSATFITFGQNTRIKKKMIDRTVVLLWLTLGKPKNWGLPKNK